MFKTSLFLLFPIFTLAQEGIVKKPAPLSEYKTDHNIIYINIDTATGTLSWKTKLEEDTGSYSVEDVRWSKFMRLTRVKKKPGEMVYYSVHVPVDSGLYKICIRSFDKDGRAKAKIIEIPQPIEKPHGIIDAKDLLFMYHISRFQIYDRYGKLLKEGYAEKIDVSDMDSGVYYWNYDNTCSEFIRKKKK